MFPMPAQADPAGRNVPAFDDDGLTAVLIRAVHELTAPEWRHWSGSSDSRAPSREPPRYRKRTAARDGAFGEAPSPARAIASAGRGASSGRIDAKVGAERTGGGMSDLRKFTLSKDTSRGDWELRQDGAARATKRFATKGKATQGGVLKEALGREGGSVKIRKEDGTYQEERTFPRSADPRRSKG